MKIEKYKFNLWVWFALIAYLLIGSYLRFEASQSALLVEWGARDFDRAFNLVDGDIPESKGAHHFKQCAGLVRYGKYDGGLDPIPFRFCGFRCQNQETGIVLRIILKIDHLRRPPSPEAVFLIWVASA